MTSDLDPEQSFRRSLAAALLTEAHRPLPEAYEGAVYFDVRRTTLVRFLASLSFAKGHPQRSVRAAIDDFAAAHPGTVETKNKKGVHYLRLFVVAPGSGWDSAIPAGQQWLTEYRGNADHRVNSRFAEHDVEPSARKDSARKTCAHCHESKTRDAFTLRKAGDPNGALSSWCRACTLEKRKATRQAKSAATPATRRAVVPVGTNDDGTTRTALRHIDADGNIVRRSTADA